ncbi:MAG: hypothetical protein LBI20_02765 [Holosporales bacterium]|nr:hypothetical protein [Holosporales bacterium]
MSSIPPQNQSRRESLVFGRVVFKFNLFRLRRQIMEKLFTLKIESDRGVALVSRNATQSLAPTSKTDIRRDLDLRPIEVSKGEAKWRCCIETQDVPDTSLLKSRDPFRITSILQFREYGADNPNVPYVADSLEREEDSITYRPILSMVLTDFKVKSDNVGKATWHLEFEEC